MQVVFAINRLGLIGLGATLTSLIKHCSNSSQVNFNFLCSGITANDQQNISTLLMQLHFKGNFKFIKFNAKEKFGHLHALHGDWTTYGRLLIPDLFEDGVVLYLDSDLIITTDILLLQKVHVDKTIAAVFHCFVDWCLEKNFFVNKLNWNAKTEYFSAGVLLFNIDEWKSKNTLQKVTALGNEYGDEFLSADQALLNLLCKGNFTHLPENFNVAWYPSAAAPDNINHAIIHFIGSPKPWDVTGKYLHKGYSLWKTYNTKFWAQHYRRFSLPQVKRLWNIKNSVAKYIVARLQKS